MSTVAGATNEWNEWNDIDVSVRDVMSLIRSLQPKTGSGCMIQSIPAYVVETKIPNIVFTGGGCDGREGVIDMAGMDIMDVENEKERNLGVHGSGSVCGSGSGSGSGSVHSMDSLSLSNSLPNSMPHPSLSSSSKYTSTHLHPSRGALRETEERHVCTFFLSLSLSLSLYINIYTYIY